MLAHLTSQERERLQIRVAKKAIKYYIYIVKMSKWLDRIEMIERSKTHGTI